MTPHLGIFWKPFLNVKLSHSPQSILLDTVTNCTNNIQLATDFAQFQWLRSRLCVGWIDMSVEVCFHSSVCVVVMTPHYEEKEMAHAYK